MRDTHTQRPSRRSHPPVWRLGRRQMPAGLLVAAMSCAFAVASTPHVVRAQQEDSQAMAASAHKMALHYMKQRKYAKAAELFHEAFAIARTPAYLFNAARAEQRAFALDKAREHFQAYLKLSDIGDDGRRRARVHLQEIDDTQAQLQKAKSSAGDAEKLKAEAALAEAERAKQQVEAARQEAEAERQRAEAAQMLAETARQQAEEQARRRQSEEAARKAAQEAEARDRASTPAPATAPGQVQRDAEAGTEGGWKRPVGWVSVAIGLVGLGAGAWLWRDSVAWQADLDARTDQRAAANLITGVDYQTYAGEQNDINGQNISAGVLAGLGGGALVAGAILVATAPSAEVSVVPLDGGVWAAWSVRF